jgi:prepilin signal peptidase PulO-like enzyme (type II secretory pathway)
VSQKIINGRKAAMIFGSKKRRHANWPFRWSLVAIFLAIVFAVAISTLLTQPFGRDPISQRLAFQATFLSRCFDVLSACWFFALGSSIGSFLNVVAYRLPLGISLSGYSRCPYCYVPIVSRDNIPVLGWIKLRGRCRACRLPISPRYPIVEAICGTFFLLMFISEIWIPSLYHYVPYYVGDSVNMSRTLPYYRLSLVLVLLTWLFTMALIRYDRSPMPIGMAIFGAAIVIAACFVLPGLADIMMPFIGESLSPVQIAIGGVARMVMGTLCGLGAAIATYQLLPRTVFGPVIIAGPESNAIATNEVQQVSLRAADVLPSVLDAPTPAFVEPDLVESSHGASATLVRDVAFEVDRPAIEERRTPYGFGAFLSWCLAWGVTGACVGIFGSLLVLVSMALVMVVVTILCPRQRRASLLEPTIWFWLGCMLHFAFSGALYRSAYWFEYSAMLQAPLGMAAAVVVALVGFLVLRFVAISES